MVLLVLFQNHFQILLDYKVIFILYIKNKYFIHIPYFICVKKKTNNIR